MGELELLDIVDENDELTGVSKPRNEVHAEGLLHRTVHIWVRSKEGGRVLVQKVSKDKTDNPGKLNISAAGHITAGVEPNQGAHEELLEEIGINIPASEFKCVKKIRDSRPTSSMPVNHEQMLYMYFIDLPEATEFKFTDGEVEDVFWMDISEFETVLEEGELKDSFVNHNNEYFEYVIDQLRSKK